MAIAELQFVVLDCPEPRALAEFYAAVLGGRIEGEGDWVKVVGHDGTRLAFQEAPGFVPPQWPKPDQSQQFHLDLYLDGERLDAAEEQVLALGARKLQGDEDGTLGFRVYADPAGHPFCLCVT